MCVCGLTCMYVIWMWVKNNPDHPYRTHPEIALTAIPTLIAWGQDGPGARLVEGECHSQEAVVELYASLQ